MLDLAGIILFCLPLYIFKVSFFGIPTNIFEVLFLTAFVVWFVVKKIKQEKIFSGYFQKNTLLVGGSAVLGAGIILSSLFNENTLRSAGIIKSWFVVPVLFFVLLKDVLREQKNKDRLLFYFCASGFLVAALSLLAPEITYDGRLASYFNNPNYLAMYLAPVLAASFYWYKISELKTKRIILAGSITVFLAAFFTFSYSNWLGLVCAAFFAGRYFLSKKDLYKLTVIVVILLALLVLFNNQKFSNLFKDRSSMDSRTEIWLVSAEMIKETNGIGVGLGNFQDRYLALQSKFPPYINWAVLHAHNTFLQFFAETGFLGALGFLLILFSFLKSVYLFLKKNTNQNELYVFLGAFYIYFLVAGLFDTLYFKNDASVIFWFFSALI
jgi:O-antigen ligase